MRRSPRKTHLAQIWAVATAVNAHEEFQMCLTDDRVPAVWPTAHPSFALLNTEQNTVASVWAPYRPGDRTLMPLAVRVHHMAADGLHVAQLLDGLQDLLADPTWVG